MRNLGRKSGCAVDSGAVLYGWRGDTAGDKFGRSDSVAVAGGVMTTFSCSACNEDSGKAGRGGWLDLVGEKSAFACPRSVTEIVRRLERLLDEGSSAAESWFLDLLPRDIERRDERLGRGDVADSRAGGSVVSLMAPSS